MTDKYQEPDPTSKKYQKIHKRYLLEIMRIKQNIDCEILNAMSKLNTEEQHYSSIRQNLLNATEYIKEMHKEGTVYVPE